MENLPYFAILACCLVLAGCASRPAAWQPPAATVPEKWATVTAAAGTAVPESWWKDFGDPQLDALIARSLGSNNDFAAAALRVRRAALQAGLVATNRTPSVAAGVNTSASRSFNPVATTRSSGINASASLEADLWGRLSSQRAAADFEAEATTADCHAFAAGLAVTTAELYWQVAYLNQLLDLNAGDIDYAEKTLALVRTKHEAGAVSGLNTAQAELNLFNLQAARTQLVQQRVQARHALAILLDQPPDAPAAERPSLPDAPLPEIAAGLPAATLARRPDLRAAELRLRETLAYTEATRASFYPTLTLTGSLGTASTALVDLLKNPVATLGAGLALPFIQWNTRQLTVRVSETQYEEAVVNFRQRLYAALAEVEDGLSARDQLRAESERLVLAREQARRAESIAGARYQAGVTEVQLWLDAQLALRSAERSVLANRFNQLNNQANLYRALGLGGGPAQPACGAS